MRVIQKKINMKKLFIILIVIMLTTAFLSGCRFDVPEGYQKRPHSRQAAQNYINDYLGADIVISENYEDIKDEYDRKIRRWGAEHQGISFFVVTRQDMIFDTTGEYTKDYYHLATDFNFCATEKIFNSLPEAKSLLKIFGGDEYLRYRDEVYINVDMADRADLDLAFAQAQLLFDTVRRDYSDMPLSFAFRVRSYLSGNEISIAHIEKFDEESCDMRE